MKIQNNTYSLNFSAGMTSKIKNEISSCDIMEISREFKKHNIATDFKDNKVVAWCSYKTYQLYQDLVKKLNLNLSMPNQILVEDFDNLIYEGKNKNSAAVFIAEPIQIYKNSDKTCIGKTIIFNAFQDRERYGYNSYWDNLDKHANKNYSQKFVPTDFFMDDFIHEFAHNLHHENMKKGKTSEEYINLINNSFSDKNRNVFENQYKQLIKSKLGSYASNSFIEAIGCDLTQRIVQNIDGDNLVLKNSICKNNPYKEMSSFSERMFMKFANKYDKMIRRFWNGEYK